MLHAFSRTEILFGKEAMYKLKNAHIAIFGLGGVGAYTAEALARSGVCKFSLIDDDKVCLTNINRQLIATTKTIGKEKVLLMKQRLLEINENIDINCYNIFFSEENQNQINFGDFTYIVDAIDTVSSKLILIKKANEIGVDIISSMGAANKINPTMFEVCDIYKTSICPLAKVMRKELKKHNIKNLKVVYSKEQPIKPLDDDSNSCKYNCVCPEGTIRKCSIRRQIPGSTSFVPPVAGFILASEVVKDIAL